MAVDADRALLARMGLARADDEVEFVPLTGGVSSDIRLVRVGDRRIVLKRALPQLKVAAYWSAPVERGAAEARWLQYVSTVAPDAVPAVLATDPDTYVIALEYLAPERCPNWKSELLAGRVDTGLAAQVGQILGRIHSASATTSGLADEFANQELFESLRIEPYFRRTAAAVPEAARALDEVIALWGANSRVLVHGDVSPKNILAGLRSPIILDAECATWGDPAFDAAFCLSHLALKAEHLPPHATELARAATALRTAYLAEADWEPAAELEHRIDRMLPAMLLARVAGASPVEYLNEPERHRVRGRAIAALNNPDVPGRQ
ncbi:aminoglycoside phosphotransferase [Enemella evansiae]|uniref:phosphotransferase family protein n=1 Tax=Enemella evansiae TaxID=2016499 RepID=UPI000B97BABA|nr:aminoglycoside phosphotransferase family protein [Enemella evansiae]OYN99058.1 aminoglycoside phosphotransferase [Enemella evansiae]